MPDASVVIPTIGRHAVLRRVLDRLERQTVASDRFEVIVVLDAAEPDPAGVESAIGRRHYPLRLLSGSVPGTSAARNEGWRASSAPLVVFLDDDVLPVPRLLGEHLAWHARYEDELVGVLGRVEWAGELKVTPFMRWVERRMQFDYSNIKGIEAGWGRFYTANASVKRRLLERVGGFDEERLPFGYEDLDLAYRMNKLGLYRMNKLGFRLLYNRRALAEHLHPMDIEFWRRRVARIAASERRFVALHAEVRPHFLLMFEQAASRPPARGRGAKLLGVIPRWLPWLGPRAWASADLHFRQALAPRFLEAWERAGAEDLEAPVKPDLSERGSTHA